MSITRIFTAFVIVLFAAIPAFAQDNETHWGLRFDVAPSSEFPSGKSELFGAANIDLISSEFRIGFDRGKELGGHWGASLVRKNFSDSRVDLRSEECFYFGCLPEGDLYLVDGVTLTGVEVYKFIHFATIRNRVEVGMDLAAGIGSLSGNIERHRFTLDRLAPNRPPFGVTETVKQMTAEEAYKEASRISTVLLGRLELASAVRVAPGWKVKVSGGINVPGVQKFSIGVVHVFGTSK